MQLQDPKGVSPVLYVTAVCMFAHTYMALLTFSSQLLHASGRQVLVRGRAHPHMDMMVIRMIWASPHMPPCPETPALTLQLTLPGSGGLHSPISEWEMALGCFPGPGASRGSLAPLPGHQQSSDQCGHWEPGPSSEDTRHSLLTSLSGTAQDIMLRGSSNAGVWQITR